MVSDGERLLGVVVGNGFGELLQVVREFVGLVEERIDERLIRLQQFVQNRL